MNRQLDDFNKIGIIYNKNIKYPDFPFNPDEKYPEFEYNYQPQSNNLLFKEMRILLNKMGFDSKNFGTKNWNPLKSIIKKGDIVLIKPNFVIDNKKNPFSVITHPSIIRFLIDYSVLATGSEGKIIVADAPQTNSNLEKIKNYTLIEYLIDYFKDKGFPVYFYDLRLESSESIDGIWMKRKKLKGDPEGFKIIDLKKKSFLFDLENRPKNKFYGADYDIRLVNQYHNILRNLYCISKTMLKADVVISVPKLKTHKKAGVTLNLKNMVGINIHKNFLPHYKINLPNKGGDAYPNMNTFLNFMRSWRYLLRNLFLKKYESKIGKFFYLMLSKRKFIENLIVKTFFPQFHQSYNLFDGDWWGNDTIWRTILDLNLILNYADKNGIMQKKPQRRFFSIIDGITGGEKDGPLNPSRKDLGLILIGNDLFVLDLIAVKLMGFNFEKIPLMKAAFNTYEIYDSKYFKLDQLNIISTNDELNGVKYHNINENLFFIPPKGWKYLSKI